jgi:thiol-disulfide isomerase/thioredoxin
MPTRLRLAIALTAAALSLALQAQALTIADDLAAVKAAVGQQDFPTAWQHCHAILNAADARDAATLTGPDLYAIGIAHYYLVAEALDKALAAGGLDAEQAQFAQDMRDHIMAPPLKVKLIGHGERVDLQQHLVPGKTTIFDFASDYCQPCLLLAPVLEELAASRADIAVVKVDINRPGVQGIDWRSPVARQFNLHSIPHLKIFGPDGALLAEGPEAMAMLQEWTNQ